MRAEAPAVFEYRRRPDRGMDLTPLIDVVFQLLIFFMVSSQFVKQEAILELPMGRGGAKADPSAPVVVEVTAAGDVLVNGERCGEGSFEGVLGSVLEETGQRDVQFRGDRTVPYGDFVELMEAAKRAGAGKFQLVKDKEGESEGDGDGGAPGVE